MRPTSMFSSQPMPDKFDGHIQIKSHFTKTPGLTPILGGDALNTYSGTPYNKVQSVHAGLAKIYNDHNLVHCPHMGLHYAGSYAWTSIEDREKTPICVVELLERQIQDWGRVDKDVRDMLDANGIGANCGSHEVPVRYYIYWRADTSHNGDGMEEIFPDGPDRERTENAAVIDDVGIERSRTRHSDFARHAARTRAARRAAMTLHPRNGSLPGQYARPTALPPPMMPASADYVDRLAAVPIASVRARAERPSIGSTTAHSAAQLGNHYDQGMLNDEPLFPDAQPRTPPAQQGGLLYAQVAPEQAHLREHASEPQQLGSQFNLPTHPITPLTEEQHRIFGLDSSSGTVPTGLPQIVQPAQLHTSSRAEFESQGIPSVPYVYALNTVYIPESAAGVSDVPMPYQTPAEAIAAQNRNIELARIRAAGAQIPDFDPEPTSDATPRQTLRELAEAAHAERRIRETAIRDASRRESAFRNAAAANHTFPGMEPLVHAFTRRDSLPPGSRPSDTLAIPHPEGYYSGDVTAPNFRSFADTVPTPEFATPRTLPSEAGMPPSGIDPSWPAVEPARSLDLSTGGSGSETGDDLEGLLSRYRVHEGMPPLERMSGRTFRAEPASDGRLDRGGDGDPAVRRMYTRFGRLALAAERRRGVVFMDDDGEEEKDEVEIDEREVDAEADREWMRGLDVIEIIEGIDPELSEV